MVPFETRVRVTFWVYCPDTARASNEKDLPLVREHCFSRETIHDFVGLRVGIRAVLYFES